MPRMVSVVCPECKSEAVFQFARAVSIEKKYIDAFIAHKHLHYFNKRTSVRANPHIVVFYPRLSIESHNDLTDLPDGYSQNMWQPCSDRYLVTPVSNFGDKGTINCKCGVRRKHELVWPKDAFYTIKYRSSELWAFNRDMAIRLRNFIAAADRDIFKYSSNLPFLNKIPKPFLTAKARTPIVTKLDKLLAGS